MKISPTLENKVRELSATGNVTVTKEQAKKIIEYVNKVGFLVWGKPVGEKQYYLEYFDPLSKSKNKPLTLDQIT